MAAGLDVLELALVVVGLMAGQSVQVALPEMQWNGHCEFRPPQADAATKKLNITLRAGRANDVQWPG